MAARAAPIAVTKGIAWVASPVFTPVLLTVWVLLPCAGFVVC